MGSGVRRYVSDGAADYAHSKLVFSGDPEPESYSIFTVAPDRLAQISYAYKHPKRKGRTEKSPQFVRSKTSATVLCTRPRVRLLRGTNLKGPVFDLTPKISPVFSSLSTPVHAKFPCRYSEFIIKLLDDSGWLLPVHKERLSRYPFSNDWQCGRMAVIGAAYPVLFDCLLDGNLVGGPNLGKVLSSVSWAFRERTLTGACCKLFGGPCGKRIRKQVLEILTRGRINALGYVAALKEKNEDKLQELLSYVLEYQSFNDFPSYKWRDIRKWVRLMQPFLKSDVLRDVGNLDQLMFRDTGRLLERVEYLGGEKKQSLDDLHSELIELNHSGLLEPRYLAIPKALRDINGLAVGKWRIVVPFLSTHFAQWGLALSNCMSMYVRDVEEGSYVFVLQEDGVLAPEYAVEVYRGVIRQFVGKFNQSVPHEMHELLKNSLSQAGLEVSIAEKVDDEGYL